jgi:HTH-type transcriptional regulator/antitoxin HigA
MGLQPIQSEEEYQKATARIIELFNAEAGTAEEEELEQLLELVSEYEEEYGEEDEDEESQEGEA